MMGLSMAPFEQVAKSLDGAERGFFLCADFVKCDTSKQSNLILLRAHRHGGLYRNLG
ncbi:hypothetical protein CCP2SC5_250037 [Azospirillaceae bacterium]